MADLVGGQGAGSTDVGVQGFCDLLDRCLLASSTKGEASLSLADLPGIQSPESIELRIERGSV